MRFADLVLMLYYGEPGAGGEAALRSGYDAVLMDIDINDSEPYFHKIAPLLYGPEGARVTVVRGDALVREQRVVAEAAHERGSDVWLVYSTPPCVRGSTAVELVARPDPRTRKGDTPPARGDFGKRGAKQEVLSSEIATRQQEYREKGVYWNVETTAGTAYQPGAGVAVTEVNELEYGVRLRGAHKVYAPADRPLYVDSILRE